MKTLTFAMLMVCGVLAFAAFMWYMRWHHIQHCSVCQDPVHCSECEKLGWREKGDYDYKNSDCAWGWCPHYNGRGDL